MAALPWLCRVLWELRSDHQVLRSNNSGAASEAPGLVLVCHLLPLLACSLGHERGFLRADLLLDLGPDGV